MTGVQAASPAFALQRVLLELENTPVVIPIAAILQIVDPVRSPPWYEVQTRFTPAGFKDLVDSTIAGTDRRAAPWDRDDDGQRRSWVPAERHAARIAWLIEHDWTDPIVLNAWSYEAFEHPLMDGNHRLYAAILRGDQEISVDYDGPAKHMEPWITGAFHDAWPKYFQSDPAIGQPVSPCP